MINFRKTVFYLKDAIKGAKIKSHVEDINIVLFTLSYEEQKKLLNKRLEKLLDHARQTVPFYSNQQDSDMESYPVVNKTIIKENLDSFFSKGIDSSKLTRVVTSGSTGTPFAVYHDASKKLRNTADTILFGNLAGYDLGMKLNYLKIWTVVNRKSGFKSFMENINPIDVTQLGDDNVKALLYSFLSSRVKQSFLGYASALETICNYLDRNSPNIRIPNVASVIAMSEGLSPVAKEKIHTYFGVHAVSRYSNVENGIIAQQMPNGSNEFEINWASYYIEILAFEADTVVEIGVLGRIVITDLFNFGMPMIRYDTGDVGSFMVSSDNQRLLLRTVDGRKMDQVFNTNGEIISSFTITNNMWEFTEINQYQFIQTGIKSYMFKLNLNNSFEREEELIFKFKQIFGLDAIIKIEYVTEIPLLNSGKRKKVINLIK